MTVELTASGGTFENILMSPLNRNPSEALAVTSEPSDLSNEFSHSDGQSKRFTFTVKGLKADEVKVDAFVVAQDPAGKSVTAGDHVKIQVGGPQLKISFGKVSLDPESELVTVKFTNTGKEPVKHIQLLSLTAIPADHSQNLPAHQVQNATLPEAVGSLAPGESTVESFYLGFGSGRYEAQALALFEDPTAKGGNGRAFATSAPFQVPSAK